MIRAAAAVGVRGPAEWPPAELMEPDGRPSVWSAVFGYLFLAYVFGMLGLGIWLLARIV